MVITEEFFATILKLFARAFFYVDLQCTLRVNNSYSTMSDGIFPIVHRTFLLSYFRGCSLLDFFGAQSMWT